MRLDGKTELDEAKESVYSIMNEIYNEQTLSDADVINIKAGFDPNQARGKDGQWSSSGGGNWNSVNLDEQMEAHNEFGGSSYDLEGNNLIGKENAFSVGVYTDKSLALPAGTSLTKEILKDYYEKHKDILLSADDLIIGTWIDEVGVHWLDITQIVNGLKEAKALKRLGIEKFQKAIFDLENVEEINTGGTGYAKK